MGVRITVGSLYHLAKDYGWAGEAPVKTAPSAEEKRQRAEARRREAEERNRREADAAAKAERMLMQAEYVDPRPRNGHRDADVPSAHPYLVAKGFPEQGGLVLDGNLLVPMRHYRDYHRLQSVQMIGPDGSKPVFPISGVFRLKGQPKRDGSIIVRSCKASQSPVYPIRDAILAVNHASCPFLSSSCPCQCGETALKTRRLPEALSPSWQDRGCTLPQLGASDNRPIRSSTPWNNRRGTDTSDN